jgi:hypothetical protein
MTGVPDADLEDLVLAAGNAGARTVEHAHLAGATLALGSPGTTVVLCDSTGASR